MKRSRGLGDVYKRQPPPLTLSLRTALGHIHHLIQAGTLRLRHREDAHLPHTHTYSSTCTLLLYSSHCTSNLALPSFSRCTPTPGDQGRHSLDTRRNKSSVTAVTLASPRTAASRRGSPTSARDARLLCCWPAPRCCGSGDFPDSKHWLTTSFLQPLPYLVTPSGPVNCQLTSSFFVGARTVVSLLQTTQIKQRVSFIAANNVYTSTNKTTIVGIETEPFF